MIDDILINKSGVIRRCLARIEEDFRGEVRRLEDFTIQDAIVLNLQRACEGAIDLAMHAVARKGLGVPQSSRDAFRLLEQRGFLDQACAKSMQSMVGFRNIAVHDYQQIQLPILESILKNRLGDFDEFIRQIREALDL